MMEDMVVLIANYVAHEDKGRPITTWRRPIGEKVTRSVWHMKIKAGPLLHEGGL